VIYGQDCAPFVSPYVGALQAHFLATSTHSPTSAPTASFDARVVYLEAPAGNGHDRLSYMAYQSEFGSDLDAVRFHPGAWEDGAHRSMVICFFKSSLELKSKMGVFWCADHATSRWYRGGGD
jgi:hypothetical protein